MHLEYAKHSSLSNCQLYQSCPKGAMRIFNKSIIIPYSTISVVHTRHTEMSQENIEKFFNKIDSTNKGYITPDEMKTLFTKFDKDGMCSICGICNTYNENMKLVMSKLNQI